MSAGPLRCPKCGAPVPLVGPHHFSCPYCSARVTVPDTYRKLFELNAQEKHARHALEHDFAQVTTPPSRWVDGVAVALVLVLPALVAGIYVAVSQHALRTAPLFAGVIVPAMLPGTGVWMWSAAVHATIVRFQLALRCDLDRDQPLCRECGAPLAAPSDAISARCAYCGTDSLIVRVAEATARLATALREELRTLADAAVALRLRRKLLVGGIAIAMTAFAALAILLVTAYQRYL